MSFHSSLDLTAFQCPAMAIQQVSFEAPSYVHKIILVDQVIKWSVHPFKGKTGTTNIQQFSSDMPENTKHFIMKFV
jgi:hypothetical protein